MLEIPYFSDDKIYSYETEIIDRFIAHSQAITTNSMDTIFEEVNFGGCAVFVEGFSKRFFHLMFVNGVREVSVNLKMNSLFTDRKRHLQKMLRNNTALVRKIIKSEKLIAEGIKIGSVSKTRGVMLYISDIANNDMVDEVRRRLNSINIQYVIAIEEIAMMLEDKTFSLTSHIFATERPDRAARALTEGRVVLILKAVREH